MRFFSTFPTVRAICLRLIAGILFAGNAFAIESSGTPAGIQQLRIYEIFDGNKAAFHGRFRDHAMRIMARHDFDILAMWETRHEGRTEFAYLLQWPDEATMKDRWARFMSDQEWSDIKRRTRGEQPLVGDIEDRTLILTDDSPHRLRLQ
ncbi:MAG: NIPSNAP family protein [Dokdonella sp.]|nr:NIPSNAP family protein [Dokdonella sp.]